MKSSEFLIAYGIEEGDYVEIETKDGLKVEGLVMPKFSKREDVLVLKLNNGYNIGLLVNRIKSMRKLKKAERGQPGSPVPLLEKVEEGDKRVLIIGCGGTIASRIDYETGAVKAYLSPEELKLSVPEMFAYASIDAESFFSILSEDMKPNMWSAIVEKVADAISKGYDGVVVTHGTDTMSYTSAALAFAFHKGLPVPIVLTGAQRSSDRPSSDSAFNLTASTLAAARAPFAEVVVVMHGETGDTYALAHRGVRVRKMHTSRRDAFQSINALPLAKIWPYEGKIEIIDPRFRKRGEQELVYENGFDERVVLIKHFPGNVADVIDALVDKGVHGIVIEGTGFGHISSDAISAVRRAIENNIPVVAASQTIFGRVNLNVYSTGRKMLEVGVIPAEDMLAEVAYVKLSWALARTRDLKEIRRLMLTNLVGEISSRHYVDLFPRWNHG
ncbi:MAG: Glu-tRNA(Gln) amidotransferase subunit GatD [Acidilobaceae archaeon]